VAIGKKTAHIAVRPETAASLPVLLLDIRLRPAPPLRSRQPRTG